MEKYKFLSETENIFTDAQKKRIKEGAHQLEIDEAIRSGDYVDDEDNQQNLKIPEKEEKTKNVVRLPKVIIKNKTRPKLEKGDVDWVTKSYG